MCISALMTEQFFLEDPKKRTAHKPHSCWPADWLPIYVKVGLTLVFPLARVPRDLDAFHTTCLPN